MDCFVVIKNNSERQRVVQALGRIEDITDIRVFESLDKVAAVLESEHKGIIIIDESHGVRVIESFCEELAVNKKDLFVILLSQKEYTDSSSPNLSLLKLLKVENYLFLLSQIVENAARKAAMKSEERATAIQIKEAKEELQRIIDAISDPIFLHNQELRLLRCNKSFARLVSKSPREIPGSYLNDLLCKEVLPEKEFILNVMEKGRSRSYECSIDRSDYFVTISPYINKNEIVGAVHFMKDMTEMKQIQERFYSSEKLISIGQLVSGVAHEINNPLAGIMGYAQLLTMQTKVEKHLIYLKEIEESVERCKKIIDNLLTFSRQKEHKKLLNSLADAVNKTLELRSYWLRTHNIIVNNCIGEIPVIRFDFQQIQQVILNIIVNAEEAIASSRDSGVITIESSADTKWVILYICNNGPAIPSDKLRNIFDPFFTTKEVGEGTGLGLSVAYGIIKAHRGQIEVINHPQKGVCFTVKLLRDED